MVQQMTHMAGEFTSAANTTKRHCTCRYLFAALLPQRRLAVIAACNTQQAASHSGTGSHRRFYSSSYAIS